MQSAVPHPRLCIPVTSRLLPTLRTTSEEPFMEVEDLTSTIEKECPGQDETVIQKVVNFLDETG